MKRIRPENYNPMWLIFRANKSSIVYSNYLGDDNIVDKIYKNCPLVNLVLSDKRFSRYAHNDKIAFIENHGALDSSSAINCIQYYYYQRGRTVDINSLKKHIIKEVSEGIKRKGDKYLVIELSSTCECIPHTVHDYNKLITKYTVGVYIVEESELPVESLRKIYIDNILKSI